MDLHLPEWFPFVFPIYCYFSGENIAELADHAFNLSNFNTNQLICLFSSRFLHIPIYVKEIQITGKITGLLSLVSFICTTRTGLFLITNTNQLKIKGQYYLQFRTSKALHIFSSTLTYESMYFTHINVYMLLFHIYMLII